MRSGGGKKKIRHRKKNNRAKKKFVEDCNIVDSQGREMKMYCCAKDCKNGVLACTRVRHGAWSEMCVYHLHVVKASCRRVALLPGNHRLTTFPRTWLGETPKTFLRRSAHLTRQHIKTIISNLNTHPQGAIISWFWNNISKDFNRHNILKWYPKFSKCPSFDKLD